MGGSYCAIRSCRRRYYSSPKDKKLSFFVIPKDHRRKIWVEKCGLDEKINLDTARICSLHFEDYDFDGYYEQMGIPMKKRLKQDAVPSLNLSEEDLETTPPIKKTQKTLHKKKKTTTALTSPKKDVKVTPSSRKSQKRLQNKKETEDVEITGPTEKKRKRLNKKTETVIPSSVSPKADLEITPRSQRTQTRSNKKIVNEEPLEEIIIIDSELPLVTSTSSSQEPNNDDDADYANIQSILKVVMKENEQLKSKVQELELALRDAKNKFKKLSNSKTSTRKTKSLRLNKTRKISKRLNKGLK